MIHLCPLALYPAQGWAPFRHSRRLRRFGLQVSGEHVDHVPLFEVLFLLQPCSAATTAVSVYENLRSKTFYQRSKTFHYCTVVGV